MKRKWSLWAAIAICILAIGITGCGTGTGTDKSEEEKSVVDENRDILENYASEMAEESRMVLGDEINMSNDEGGLISYVILKDHSGMSDRLLTASCSCYVPVKIDLVLFGVEDGAVEELDRETIDFNDAECLGGEYDLFMTTEDGKDFLFVKRNNAVDTSSCFCEGILYNINDSIERTLDAQASGAEEGFGFLVNDGEAKTVSGGELKNAFSEWAKEANSYLVEAGLTCETNSDEPNSLDVLYDAMPNYSEENESETHLCFVRKGRQEDGKVSDYDSVNILEFEDYTGVAQMMQ